MTEGPFRTESMNELKAVVDTVTEALNRHVHVFVTEVAAAMRATDRRIAQLLSPPSHPVEQSGPGGELDREDQP